MADNDKKPVISLVPAILTGTAALLAALTTVYVNVRNDIKSASQGATPATASAAASDQPQQLRLQLQRIAVQQDGAVGSADWRFAVEADGEPLFALEQEDLNSQGGRNIVAVTDEHAASASIELAPGRPLSIVVKGWRSGWLGAEREPLVFGEGTLSGAGAMAPVTVAAEDGRDGVFTFYFSAAPTRD